jgi:hypothetical protein
VVPIIAVEAAIALAALVQRSSRREIADFGRQAEQKQETWSPQPVARGCVIAVLPKFVLMRGC